MAHEGKQELGAVLMVTPWRWLAGNVPTVRFRRGLCGRAAVGLSTAQNLPARPCSRSPAGAHPVTAGAAVLGTTWLELFRSKPFLCDILDIRTMPPAASGSAWGNKDPLRLP